MADFKLLHGDVIEQLKTLDDESIDAILTDPPYNLSFMGKKWDSKGGPKAFQEWCEEWGRECYRVLRKGGHILSFGGTRTYHRMATGLEDAGFEIRDCLVWLYGTGFPKSLNVGKAIDKKLGNERTVVGLNPNHRTSDALYELGFQGGKGDGLITKGSSDWEGYGTSLKPANEPIVLAQKPKEGTFVNNALKHGVGPLNIDASRIPTNPDVDDMLRVVERKNRNPDSDWGKNSGFKNETNKLTGVPQSGRFPANVVHDGSEEVINQFPQSSTTGKRTDKSASKQKKSGDSHIGWHKDRSNQEYTDSGSTARFFYEAELTDVDKAVQVSVRKEGRFPANVVHDGSEVVVSEFPESQGGAFPKKSNVPSGQHYEGGWGVVDNETRTEYEKGSAARFFYCAKPTKKEKDAGLDSIQPQPVAWSNQAKAELKRGNDDFKHDNDGTKHNKVEYRKNTHPTVKPVKLMVWLLGLICPDAKAMGRQPVTLDCFVGSGSTGIAAQRLGFDFIGIDANSEFLDIARARIEYEREQHE